MTPRRAAAAKTSDASALGVDGFHLLVKPRNAARALVAAKNAARAVFDEPDAWRVTLLPASETEFLMTPIDDRHRPTLPDAWELARKLGAQPSIVDAEVALRIPGIEPADPSAALTPSEKVALAIPRRLQRKSFGGGDGKTCAQDPDWSVKHIHAPAAWKLASGKGKGIVIAHPDTGYTLHPEIWSSDPKKNRVRAELGADFVDGGDPMDELVGSSLTLRFPGHGTATASVIMSDVGGATNPAVSGVAPECELVPIRVSTTVIHLDFANLVAGLRHAIGGGHHVVSMSLGGPIPSNALERAVKDAVAAGIIVLAAAGNFYPFVVWPAAYDDVIAVAATNCDREPWRFSASGAAVDISAPGEAVWVARTKRDGAHPYLVEQSSGTSHAVAATAGAAAIWLSHHGRDALVARYGKENLARVFKDVLVAGGVADPPPDWDPTRYGAGILDVERLLQAPLPKAAPALPKRLPSAAGKRLDTIASFFPDLDRAKVQRAIADLLRTTVPRLSRVLDDVGDELAVHLGVDPQLREDVRRRARSLQPSSAKGRAKTIVAPRTRSSGHLRKTASQRLRKRLTPL